MSQQFIPNAGNRHLKIRAGFIHLINKAKTRNFVFLRLSPDGFALGLNPLGGVKHRHRAIQHSKRTLYLCRKIHVSGRINQINHMVIPGTFGCRRGNCNPPLLFFLQKVHDRCALMHLAHLISLARQVQNPFADGCLARVNMRHNADISQIL